jgi:hypothetical protein
MSRNTFRFEIVVCALLVTPFAAVTAVAGQPGKPQVNGTLSDVDGLPVLRVWGAAHERGFAHGYLLAPEIIRLFDGYLASGTVIDAEGYENRLLPGLKIFKVQPAYEAELRGMLAGIQARLGDQPEIPAVKRPIRYEDLLAANCMGDLLRTGCSSFAAWGSMTPDGHTITGRNMDWPRNPALEAARLVIVQVPEPDGRALGWVSVYWPALIGCTTGMNAEGVTVAMHDSNSPTPSSSGDFTSSTSLYREAIEAARAETALEDITAVFRQRYTAPGYNMMVTKPSTSGGPPAVVFEHDGDLTNNNGMTLREPENGDTFLVCTNHSRARYTPAPGARYPKLDGVMNRIATSGGSRHVTKERAWKMLTGVCFDQIIAHHSVVFEPDKRLMHVAYAENGQHAPRCKKVTLDVTKLLAGDYPGGK